MEAEISLAWGRNRRKGPGGAGFGCSCFMGSHRRVLSKEVKRFVFYNFCLATCFITSAEPGMVAAGWRVLLDILPPCTFTSPPRMNPWGALYPPPPGGSILGLRDSSGQSGSQGVPEEPLCSWPQAGQSFRMCVPPMRGSVVKPAQHQAHL